MIPGQGLKQALAELEVAQTALEDARRNLTQARSEEKACLNRANAAQKEVDKIVADIKAKAPRDTDWNRIKTPKFHEAP